MNSNENAWATPEVLNSLIAYDPDRGTFTDKRNNRRLPVPVKSKRIRIKRPDGEMAKIAPGMTAWILMTGAMPPGKVRSAFPNDYRWRNLYIPGQMDKPEEEVVPFSTNGMFQSQLDNFRRQLDAMNVEYQKRIAELEARVRYLSLLADVEGQLTRINQ